MSLKEWNKIYGERSCSCMHRCKHKTLPLSLPPTHTHTRVHTHTHTHTQTHREHSPCPSRLTYSSSNLPGIGLMLCNWQEGKGSVHVPLGARLQHTHQHTHTYVQL